MTDNLRARAEALLRVDEYTDENEWMTRVRSLLVLIAALPPDPAPTGERRPCAGWVAHPHYGCAHLLLATGPRGMLRALAALARIAEIVADTDPDHGIDDNVAIDRIRAVLAGAAEGGG